MSSNLYPETITKKWLSIELGYYFMRDGKIVSDSDMMWRHIYTMELIEDVLGMTEEQFKKIRRFNAIQTKKIIQHLFV